MEIFCVKVYFGAFEGADFEFDIFFVRVLWDLVSEGGVHFVEKLFLCFCTCYTGQTLFYEFVSVKMGIFNIKK